MSAYEKGLYAFKVTNQGFGKSEKKGTMFFFLEGIPVAQLQDGERYSVEVDYPRTIRLYITENTADTVIEKLQSLGWQGGKWSTLEPSNPSGFSLVGQEIEAVCKHEAAVDGSGNLYDKFDLPWGGGESLVSDPAVGNKLDAMFGKALKAKPAQKKEPATASVGRLPDDIDADEQDIPF